MNLKLLFIFSLIFIFSCRNESTLKVVKQKDSTAVFNQMLDEYYKAGLKLDPLLATMMGENSYNHLFPNPLSDEHQQNLKTHYISYLNKLIKYPESELSETARISKAVLKWDCEINLERLTFAEDMIPINQRKSPHLVIGQMASGNSSQPFNTFKDYNNWLQRLDGYLAWMKNAKSKMKEGIETKQVLPKSLIVKVMLQLEAFTNEKLEENLFYQPIKNLPESFTAEEKAALTESYTNMITNRIIPAYRSLHSFMSNDYMLAGRTSSGIDALPNGKDFYDHSIKMYTTTYMTADEIHQLGLSEVARILSEMEKVKKEVGFKGDLRLFFDHVRNNKELMPFKKPREVIANFNSIHDRMKPGIAKLFDVKIKALFEVRRTEAFREKTANANYAPGSLDGTSPGIFYVPSPDVTKYNTFSDESLFCTKLYLATIIKILWLWKILIYQNSEKSFGIVATVKAGHCTVSHLEMS